MDLEILELVNKALEAVVAHDLGTAQAVLKDIVAIYDERSEAQATQAVYDDEYANTLNEIFGGDPVSHLSRIFDQTTRKRK